MRMKIDTKKHKPQRRMRTLTIHENGRCLSYLPGSKKFTVQIERTYFFFHSTNIICVLIFTKYTDNHLWGYEIYKYSPCSKGAHRIIRLEGSIYGVAMNMEKESQL